MTKWCKVRQPDEKYKNYQVPLYLDEKSWKTFEASGCQLEVKEDTDGKYVTFKRNSVEFNYAKKEEQENGPPVISIQTPEGTYVPFPDGLIGNGSIVTIRVDIYDTRNGKGHRLVSLGVDKLIEYTKTEGTAAQLAMPF